MNESEIFTEWVASQKKKLTTIASWPDLTDWQRTSLAIQSIKPFFYYKQEATERAEDDIISRDLKMNVGKSSGGGQPAKTEGESPRQGTPIAAASSNPKCGKCGKEFTPRTPTATLCFDCWKKDRRR